MARAQRDILLLFVVFCLVRYCLSFSDCNGCVRWSICVRVCQTCGSCPHFHGTSGIFKGILSGRILLCILLVNCKLLDFVP